MTKATVIDLVGQRFGHLVVVKREGSNGGAVWLCSCDCGGGRKVLGKYLRAGLVKSCGCSTRLIDLTGQVFGALTVIRLSDGRREKSGARWLCRCECGNEHVVRSGHLKDGTTTSCGCLGRAARSERVARHRMTGTKTHWAWVSMRQRCNKPNSQNYPRYGARGIFVCARWNESFEAFLEDMGEAPVGTSIDRIDVNGNYEPSNCRWADNQVQQNNKRTSQTLTYEGQTHTQSEWGLLLGIPKTTIFGRVKKGLPVEEVLRQNPRQATKPGHSGA